MDIDAMGCQLAIAIQVKVGVRVYVEIGIEVSGRTQASLHVKSWLMNEIRS